MGVANLLNLIGANPMDTPILSVVLAATEGDAGTSILTGATAALLSGGVMGAWNRQLQSRLNGYEQREKERQKQDDAVKQELIESNRTLRALILPLNTTAQRVAEKVPSSDRVGELESVLQRVLEELTQRGER